MPRYIYEYVAKRNCGDYSNALGYEVMSFLHGITETYDDAIKQFNYKLHEMGDRKIEYTCVIIKNILDPLDIKDLYMMHDVDNESLLNIIDDYSEKHIYILNNNYELVHDYLFFRCDAYDVFENVALAMYNKAKEYTTGKKVVDIYTGNEYIITDGFTEYLYSFTRLCEREYIGPTIDLQTIDNSKETIVTNDISRFRIIE